MVTSFVLYSCIDAFWYTKALIGLTIVWCHRYWWWHHYCWLNSLLHRAKLLVVCIRVVGIQVVEDGLVAVLVLSLKWEENMRGKMTGWVYNSLCKFFGVGLYLGLRFCIIMVGAPFYNALLRNKLPTITLYEQLVFVPKRAL